MDKNNSCIYITYDVNLKTYLKNNNISDILYGMHPKTNKLFWVYERNENFNKILNEWLNK